MNALRAGILCSALFSGMALAQVSADVCAHGDGSCYQAQYEAACNAGAATTVRGCRAWILSLEQRASVGDRAALHSQALAYSAIVLYLPADSEEKSASQVAALDLYRRLIALDPADADALLGAATLTGDRAERLRLLKRVVDARPTLRSIRFLISEVYLSGTTEDALYAAELAEQLFPAQQGRGKWELAARIVYLYEKAGAHEAVRRFRQRIREDIGVEALVGGLARNRVRLPEEGASVLAMLCDPSVMSAAGAEPCLRGLDAMFSAVASVPGQSGFQSLVDNAAALMAGISSTSERLLDAADAGWHARFTDWLYRLPTLAMDSVATWRAVAMIERTAARRIAALEEAFRLDAQDPRTMSDLAAEYMREQRWTDAAALYRRALTSSALPSADERRMLEHNIQQAEQMRGTSPDLSPVR